jgi:redox-sensitive bicupin YhaK (pirin superfamily)
MMSGTPIKERIAWYGPIVMNTDEELETALGELEKGTFIKAKAV